MTQAQPPYAAAKRADQIRARHRISTLLFATLTVVALAVLAGLLIVARQLTGVQSEIAVLRDQSLPRLIKLSQLSQEASASIAIAPALSTNPSRYEFETLLSRIKDKTGSQDALIAEISELIVDTQAALRLKENADALAENQTNLTAVVRRQIEVRKRLERHVENLGRIGRALASEAGEEDSKPVRLIAAATVERVLTMLLDTNRARFSRNRRQLEASIEDLAATASPSATAVPDPSSRSATAIAELLDYWQQQHENVFRDKASELTNAFKIKALVEENSLIANRLLSTASSAFSRASAVLTDEARLVASTTRNTLIVMSAVVAAVLCGSLALWVLLQRQVLRRLDQIRAALRAYSKDRRRDLADSRRDEIGEISFALSGYMDEIDRREAELQEQTAWLQRLSAQLSLYLSPQVYESIFSGKQEVKVASSRKKLTVFFSDIVNFTETADRMESEELTDLLNNYLTEMTQIALEYGATVDKYVGDAILIFFGDPETKGVRQDALACVSMAIAMRERLKALALTWREAGIEWPLNCRFGIHTGYCTVGNFGSETRMDYTIIGGTVNTASRLQSVAEPGQVLISYETFAHIKDAIDCREKGEIDVRGIAYPVATYEVIDRKDAARQSEVSIQETAPGFLLDLNLDEMTKVQRRSVAGVLRRALTLVDRTKAAAEPGENER